jgi:topoisomerase-4 subunit A
MRLRSLRRLEEMELRRERDALEKEHATLAALLASEGKQRTRLKADFRKVRDRYGAETALGRRRTVIEEAAPTRDIPLEAMIEREPVTVILSDRGWIRAMRGHVDLSAPETMKFKEGDGPAFAFHAHTTDKLLVAAANGRFYTLAADRLPGGRGFGEPVRATIDLDGSVPIVAFLRAGQAARLLVAASDGRGFVVPAAEAIAETRKGKAVIGDNRKLSLFPLVDLPEMTRGQGVQLQRYRDGGLADAKTLVFAEGLSWPMGGDSGRVRKEEDLTPWRTARGAAGRMPPTGFPRDNRF